MRGRLHHHMERGTIARASGGHIPDAVPSKPAAKAKRAKHKLGGKVRGSKVIGRLDKRSHEVPKSIREQSERKLTNRASGGLLKTVGKGQVNRIARREPGGAIASSADIKRKRRDEDDEDDDLQEHAKGGGIHIKKSHRGLLHKDTGTPQGEKIPKAKIEAAAHSPNPKVRKRAVFAENLGH